MIGFDAMGMPIPSERLARGDSHLREMAPSLSTGERLSLIGRVANALERDRPYEAFELAQQKLDLTGTYRLVAVLLAS